MSWELRWQDEALGDLLDVGRTDRRQVDRIRRAAQVAARSDQGDIRKLAGQSDEWRLRVGDWRVVFTYDRPNRTLLVLPVRRRNEGTYRD